MSNHVAMTVAGGLLSTMFLNPGFSLTTQGATGVAKDAIQTPVPPAVLAVQRARLQENANLGGREGTTSTLLTGQTGVSGQPKAAAPSLLGKGV